MVRESRHGSPFGSEDYEHRVCEAVSLIKPAAKLEHSSQTLWAHLIGTFQILESWGAPPNVCLAGLVHSVYSTQYFTVAVASIAKRRAVARRIGAEAERLAYWFCVLDRESLALAERGDGTRVGARVRRHASGEIARLAGSTIRSLSIISLANAVEQAQRSSGDFAWSMHHVFGTFGTIGFVPNHVASANALGLTEAGERSFREEFRSAVTVPVVKAKRLLRRCVEKRLHCAEPQLLLAAIELESGNWERAILLARAGLRDLRGWGATWVPRIPLPAWKLLGIEIVERARATCGDLPVIAEDIRKHLKGLPG